MPHSPETPSAAWGMLIVRMLLRFGGQSLRNPMSAAIPQQKHKQGGESPLNRMNMAISTSTCKGGATTNPQILELQRFTIVQTNIFHQIWPAWAAQILDLDIHFPSNLAGWAAGAQARVGTASNHMPGPANSPDLKKKHGLLPQRSAACLTPPGILRIPGSVRHAEVAHYLTAHDATSMPHSPENPPDSRRRGAC